MIGQYKILRLLHVSAKFCNRAILIVGATNSGKTHLVRSILISIKPIQPLVVLFAPTNTFKDDNNDSLLPAGVIIHDARALDKALEGIVSSQIRYLAAYDKVACFDFQEQLLGRMGQLVPSLLENIKALSARFREKGRSTPNKTELARQYRASLEKEFKAAFLSFKNTPHLESLSVSDRMAIFTLARKPHACVIFDDLGTQVRESSVFRNLCIRYRHVAITLIQLVHSASTAHPLMRTNADLIIANNPATAAWLIDEKDYIAPPGSASNFMKLITAISNHRPYLFYVLARTDAVMATEAVYSTSQPFYKTTAPAMHKTPTCASQAEWAAHFNSINEWLNIDVIK